MTKKVTNEKLALMIKNGFDEVHEKFDSKFNSLNSKINGVKKELKKDIKRVEKNLSMDIGRVEKKLDAEVDRHDDQDLKIKNHENRIIIVEKKLEKV